MRLRSKRKSPKRRKPENDEIYPAAYPGGSQEKSPPISQKTKHYQERNKASLRSTGMISGVFFFFGGHSAKLTSVNDMAFFSNSIQILQTLVTAIGAGLGAWGGINLLEGYGNDNPGAKSQGIKQLMAGGGVILIGTQLIPQLANLF